MTQRGYSIECHNDRWQKFSPRQDTFLSKREFNFTQNDKGCSDLCRAMQSVSYNHDTSIEYKTIHSPPGFKVAIDRYGIDFIVGLPLQGGSSNFMMCQELSLQIKT